MVIYGHVGKTNMLGNRGFRAISGNSKEAGIWVFKLKRIALMTQTQRIYNAKESYYILILKEVTNQLFP